MPGYAKQLASAQASHATYANVARLHQFFFAVSAVVCITQDPPKVCTSMYTLILHGTQVCIKLHDPNVVIIFFDWPQLCWCLLQSDVHVGKSIIHYTPAMFLFIENKQFTHNLFS